MITFLDQASGTVEVTDPLIEMVFLNGEFFASFDKVLYESLRQRAGRDQTFTPEESDSGVGIKYPGEGLYTNRCDWLSSFASKPSPYFSARDLSGFLNSGPYDLAKADSSAPQIPFKNQTQKRIKINEYFRGITVHFLLLFTLFN